MVEETPASKARKTYVWLALLLGPLGVHNFYAGYLRRGAIQLAIGGAALIVGSQIKLPGLLPDDLASLDIEALSDTLSSLPVSIPPLAWAAGAVLLAVTLWAIVEACVIKSDAGGMPFK